MDELQHFLNSDVGSGVLLFAAAMSLAVALFHTIIFSELFNTEKSPKFLFAAYPAAILAVGFLLKPGFGMALFALLFVSTFVLGLIMMLTGIFRSGIEIAKAKNPKASMLTKILGGVTSLLFMLTFFVSPAFLFLLLLVIFPFISSLMASNSKTFYQSQRSLPTSKIRSLSMGLAEISGKAKHIKLMNAPLKSKTCIGYHYTIEDISTDDEGHTSYHEVFAETKCNSFYLDDGTGKILILDELPEFLDFDIDHQYTAGQRYTQYLLSDGMDVLLVGAAKPGENGTAVFGRDEVRKVFGISPTEKVEAYNRTRPLRQAAVVFAYIFALLVAAILITPIRLSKGRIIFEKVKLWKSSEKSPQDDYIYESRH